MNRHRFLLTICTLLAGSVGSPQQPAAQQSPRHSPFPGYAPGHPALLRDDLDGVKAQLEILRSQIDPESIREQVDSARIWVEGAREMAHAMAGKFVMDPVT